MNWSLSAALKTNAVVAICVVLVPTAAVVEVGVPVNAGEASGAKPEIDAPPGIVTVPVKVGEAIGAFRPMAVAVVVAKLASSPKASANSLRVFKVPGAESTSAATAASV